MKKPIAWMVAAMASILLISAASADEPKALVAKAAAESKVPTLTYYYFDG
jgi:ABC-type glycerol-3-phosphate transport system substrate-binding protein